MATRKQKAVGGAGPASSPAGSPRVAAAASPVPRSPRPAGRGEVVVPAGQDGRSSVRERLVRATIDVVSTVGYEATTVEQIVATGGLARTALYRHFGNRHGALVQACRQVLEDWQAAVGRALPESADADARQRAVAGLTALTQALAADPPAAAVVFLDSPAAGADGRALRGDLIALIAGILGDPPGLPAWSPAGAVFAILHGRIARGETDGLPSLVPDLAKVATVTPTGR